MTQAYIYEVRGEKRLFDLTPLVAAADWTQLLDGIGSGQVTLLPGTLSDTVLNSTEPWLHELHLYEEGVPVFQGPILYVTMPQTSKTSGMIVARDVANWMKVRLLHKVMDYLNTPGKTVIRDIVNTALSPPVLPWSLGLEPNVLPFVKIHGEGGPPDVVWPGYAACLVEVPYGHSAPRAVAWDRLRALFGSESHLSVHGRRMNFWPYATYLPNADLPRVDADSFDDFPALVKDGDTLATYVSVPCRDLSMRYFPAVEGTRLPAGSLTFDAQPWIGFFGGNVANYNGVDPTSENRGMFLGKIQDMIAAGEYITLPPLFVTPGIPTSVSIASPGFIGIVNDGFVFTAYSGYSSWKALQTNTNLLVERVIPRPNVKGWAPDPAAFVPPPYPDTVADQLRQEVPLIRSVGSGGSQDLVVTLDCGHLWKPEWLVCGAKATISAKAREYTLQVHEINGEWGGKVSVRLAALGGPPNWAVDPTMNQTGFWERPEPVVPVDVVPTSPTPGTYDQPATGGAPATRSPVADPYAGASRGTPIQYDDV